MAVNTAERADLSGRIPVSERLSELRIYVKGGARCPTDCKRSGYSTTEYQHTFISHFGRNPDFAAIVRAPATHPVGLLREELGRLGKIARSPT